MAAERGRRRALVWFRNDLRTHDNEPLHEAVKLVKRETNVEILPVYCFDPRYFETSDNAFYGKGFGAQKTGYIRAKFILESVLTLKQELKKIGSDLMICVGKPEEILPSLLTVDGGNKMKPTIFASAEVGPEEKLVERAVRNAIRPLGGSLNLYWTNSLYNHDQVLSAFGGLRLPKLPNGFTSFKNKVENKCSIPAPLPKPRKNSLPLPQHLDQQQMKFIPTLEKLPWTTEIEIPRDPICTTAFPFSGGEITGLQRVEHYFKQTDAVANYFQTRNGMLGTEYSTKFSPWLACGALSARYIQSRLDEYEQQVTSNKSTYWVKFEMTWRDFFWFFTLKHGKQIFQLEGLTNASYGGAYPTWSRDIEILKKWKQGMTGMPMVDANMRELLQTGWMSNRGRQNVASYLIHDLGIDWRMGAEHFEETLLDYDVASNWGNWVAAAGLTGGRINRFNVIKQGNDYDPQGQYVRAWCPELKNVDNRFIHTPFKMPESMQSSSNCVIGTDYPAPMKNIKPYVPRGGPNRGGRKNNNRKNQQKNRKRKRYRGYYKN